VIGYLYNFVKDGQVYSYQSGFDYDLLPRSKPGWLCHHLAVEHNLQRGMTGYDLLAGACQFKASFGKAHKKPRVGDCGMSRVEAGIDAPSVRRQTVAQTAESKDIGDANRACLFPYGRSRYFRSCSYPKIRIYLVKQ
jgi:hypothetical protein